MLDKKHNNNTYCKVFINTDLDEASLLSIISQLINGKINNINTITSRYIDLDVISNDEFNEKNTSLPKSGFLFYRYFLDVEPIAGTKYENYLSSLKILINGLRKRGFKVIPSCDFEDELNEGKPYTEWMK